MKHDLIINNDISIPMSEFEIKSSRSGGPGGQHVNKTETKITVIWNLKKSTSLSETQKERMLKNLHNRLTPDGNLVVHSSDSRSQQQNKENALASIALILKKALHVPKKRIKTTISKGIKEARLQEKTTRSSLKKMRKKVFEID